MFKITGQRKHDSHWQRCRHGFSDPSTGLFARVITYWLTEARNIQNVLTAP